MSGKSSGVDKKIVLLRMPKPLYDSIVDTSKGISVQSIILNTLRLKYARSKPRKQTKNEKH